MLHVFYKRLVWCGLIYQIHKFIHLNARAHKHVSRPLLLHCVSPSRPLVVQASSQSLFVSPMYPILPVVPEGRPCSEKSNVEHGGCLLRMCFFYSMRTLFDAPNQPRSQRSEAFKETPYDDGSMRRGSSGRFPCDHAL